MHEGGAAHGRSRDESEAWLLGALEEKPLPLRDILAALAYHGSAGFDRRVDGWAELVQETLQEAEDRQGLLALLALRCSWRDADRAFTAVCKKAIEVVFSSRVDKVLIACSGFDALPPVEAVRRFRLLTSLQKGTLCREKTWGFGVVKRLDDFYKRVTIDFDTKRGHEMALSYAAEVLEILPPEHFLVRLHEDGEAIRAMVAEDPAGLVRLVLESYGDLPVDDVKDRLVGTVLEEKDWKGFWMRARKAIKEDPLLYLPPKRSEPLRAIASVDDHLAETFEAFAALRVPEEILKKLDELEKGGLLASAEPSQREQVGERLAFAVWGSGTKEPVLTAKALLTAERLGLTDGWASLGTHAVSVTDAYRQLLKPGLLKRVLCGLPTRMTDPFLERVFALHPEQAGLHVPDLLAELPVQVVPEAVRHLADSGQGELVRNEIARRLAGKNASPALVYWLLKEPRNSEWRAELDETELLWQGLDALARPAAGDQLRAQHMLRGLYETPDWIAAELEVLRPEQREVFLLKVTQSAGWDEAGRRSVIANVVKAYPELTASMDRAVAPEESRVRRRMTSWRSYQERQAQFKALMEEEIPANAREIAVARSYGDLRENAEYKYAKEHQRILYLRRDEMEQDLELVQGTDFAGFATDVSGMGTMVKVQRAGAEKPEQYCILGEWDRDEALGIISSLSRLAMALEGHKPGEEVLVPSEDGTERCQILAVEELDSSIQAWLQDKG